MHGPLCPSHSLRSCARGEQVGLDTANADARENSACPLPDLWSRGCWQATTREGPLYATPAVRDVSVRIAEVAGRGLIQLGALPGGTPVSWQLIRGGAVAEPDVRRAHALPTIACHDLSSSTQ